MMLNEVSVLRDKSNEKKNQTMKKKSAENVIQM